jgi:hypothetical protein
VIILISKDHGTYEYTCCEDTTLGRVLDNLEDTFKTKFYVKLNGAPSPHYHTPLSSWDIITLTTLPRLTLPPVWGLSPRKRLLNGFFVDDMSPYSPL